MSRQGRAAIVVAIALSVALSACGVRDPYHSAPRTILPPARTLVSASARPPGAGPAAAPASIAGVGPSAGFAPAAQLGAPGSPREVAERYALAYASVTQDDHGKRQQTLVGLATQAYGRAVHRELTDPADASPGLPAGARLIARVTGIQMGPAQGDYEHAEVSMQQALRQANGTVESPFENTFEIDLLLRSGHWRVAAFTVQP